MPRHAGQPGHRREGHLLAHRENQRLVQQREARQSAGPGRLDQRHAPVRESHARHAHLEQAFVLEEVETPVALDLRVVHGMGAVVPRVGEPAAPPEVDAHGQPTLPLVEVHAVDEPGLRNAQRLRKQVSMHRPSSFGSVRRGVSLTTTAGARAARPEPAVTNRRQGGGPEPADRASNHCLLRVLHRPRRRLRRLRSNAGTSTEPETREPTYPLASQKRQKSRFIPSTGPQARLQP